MTTSIKICTEMGGLAVTVVAVTPTSNNTLGMRIALVCCLSWPFTCVSSGITRLLPAQYLAFTSAAVQPPTEITSNALCCCFFWAVEGMHHLTLQPGTAAARQEHLLYYRQIDGDDLAL